MRPSVQAAVGAVIVGLGAMAGWAVGIAGCISPENGGAAICKPDASGWLLIAAAIATFPVLLIVGTRVWRERATPLTILAATIVLTLAGFWVNVCFWNAIG